MTQLKHKPEIDAVKQRILDSLGIKYVGKGEHSNVFLLNKEHVIKTPTNGEARNVIIREAKILNLIKGKLSINIPYIKYLNESPKNTFVCMSYIQGKALTKKKFDKLEDSTKNNIAKQFALFFTEMHSIKLDLAKNTFLENLDYQSATKDFFMKKFKSVVSPFLSVREKQFAMESFHNYLSNPKNFQYTPVLVHGDLHLENMFFNNHTKEINGIIDFGNINFGDNVYDFRYLDLHLGRNFLNEVIKSYGHSISGDMSAKLELFNLCNFVYDAISSKKSKNENGFNTAIKDLKKAIKLYRKYR